ncbi:AAA family ATPase [Nocardioides campestrisoli]|uniref:AAA family ATPase n=1 Tax=Nocardioides campestrisoli TaxID=2736757 RepID=UPI00163D5B2D|nr:ATP-binding protein [Nocardioides campestrisoli]
MLLNFRVSNYRSFREEVSISFVATRLDKGFGVPTAVAADGSAVDVLPVVAILGANASGKSNLLRAMEYMRTMVLTSASRPRFAELEADPFVLDGTSRNAPTLMELDFVLDGSRYVYGFEQKQGRFTDEWLHTYPHKRSQNLFDRENTDEFQFGKNLGGQNRVIAEITRSQVLFLSAAAQAGHPLLSKIYDFFVRNLVMLDVPGRSRTSPSMIRRLTERRGQAVQLLALADLGILDARIDDSNISDERRAQVRQMIEKSIDEEELPEDEKSKRVDEILARFFESQEPNVELVHKAVKGGTSLPFEEESLGTKSWLSFVSYALDALEHGGVLLVDELDASLHPLLIAEALQLFQSPRTNRHGAQLVFTTHDVTLLSNSLERLSLSRGQVWLVEKSEHGASTLTPLSDYRPRKGEDLARGYLQGRYGGTPRILPADAGDVVVGNERRVAANSRRALENERRRG